MTTQFNTLLLDQDTWDLIADANGNIAQAAPPYALAQDVASAIKTFLGEVWYNDSIGIPYFGQILGKTPPVSVFKAYMVAAALTVPGVVSATCIISAFQNGTVTGQVQFRDSNNQTSTVSF
jgi:hypothetical protein